MVPRSTSTRAWYWASPARTMREASGTTAEALSPPTRNSSLASVSRVHDSNSHPRVGAQAMDRGVQAGDGRGVAEKGLGGVFPLPASRQGQAPYVGVGHTGGPPMHGRGPPIRIRLDPSHQPELPQPFQPVSDRSFRDPEDALELLGGDHPVLREEGDDVVICIGQEMK